MDVKVEGVVDLVQEDLAVSGDQAEVVKRGERVHNGGLWEIISVVIDQPSSDIAIQLWWHFIKQGLL